MRAGSPPKLVVSTPSGILSRFPFLLSRLGVLLVAAFLPVLPGFSQQERTAQAPYAGINRGAVDYHGPGRNSAHDLTGPEIKIGLVVPLQGPRQAEGEALIQAATLALEDEAAHSLPDSFRLVLAPRDETGPWGRASNRIVDLVLEDHALAIVTSTSGVTAHLAEQVGNRLGVPILTLASDSGTTQTNVPWIFRLGPDDAAQAEPFAKGIYVVRHLTRVLLVTEDDHDGRVGGEAFVKAARRLGGRAPEQVQINPARPELQTTIGQLNTVEPEAVVIWTSSHLSARLIEAFQQAKPAVPIYLCNKGVPAAGRGTSGPGAAVDQHQDAQGAEQHSSAPTAGVWILVPRQPAKSDPKRDFEKHYRERTGNAPYLVALQAYDAVRLIAAALRQSGPNRARLRDRLAAVQGFQGISGIISFDHAGNDVAGATLMRLD